MESLRWLWGKKCPMIPIPIVIEGWKGFPYGGCYYRPRRKEYLLGDRYVDFGRGVIVFAANKPEYFTAGTLAHEWRHHEQWCRRVHGPASTWIKGPTTKEQYRRRIVEYFLNDPQEMDALLYSHRKVPQDEVSTQWLEWIRRRGTLMVRKRFAKPWGPNKL